MNPHRFVMLPAAALVLLLLAAGCPHRTGAFKPNPEGAGAGTQPQATQPAAPSEKDKPQPIATEGFAEKPLTNGSEAQNGGAAGSQTGEPQSEAALVSIYFGYDSDDLSDEALRTLEANAVWIKSHPHTVVQIEGHCDERGTVQYNLALGQRRARSVKEHLVRLGVLDSQLDMISYGKEQPADPGHSEAAWAKNRRAEFKVISR